MDRRKTLAYHILFSLAVVSVVLGAGLLLVTTGHVRGLLALWPLFFVTAGVLLSYFSVTAMLGARFLFFGLFITSATLIRFVGVMLGESPRVYWPLYAIAAGLSMLPTHLRHYGRVKPSAVVLSSAFIVLGLFFSVFSFGWSSMRFKTFIAMWWPALFIASGVVLLAVWAIQRMVLKSIPEPSDQCADTEAGKTAGTLDGKADGKAAGKATGTDAGGGPA